MTDKIYFILIHRFHLFNLETRTVRMQCQIIDKYYYWEVFISFERKTTYNQQTLGYVFVIVHSSYSFL